MKIHRYTPERFQEVADLFHAAIHAITPSIYSRQQQEAWAPTPPDYELWRRRLEVTQPYLAIIDGRIAGFIELGPDGHIDCTYTHPRYQHQGVATALYRHLEGVARGLGLQRLTVEASAVALPFFQRQGFVVTGENVVERNGVQLNNYSMEKPISN